MADSRRHRDDEATEDGFFAETTQSKKGKTRERAIGFINEAVDESRDLQSGATETIRGDLQPFTDAGTQAAGGLNANLANIQSLINDPNAQKDFVTNNPFFELLKKDATDTLFGNKAAGGKVGTGGTAEALQNSFLLLGPDLVNQNVSQNIAANQQQLGVSQLGLQSAGTAGAFTQQGTSNITDLITSGAQANAANLLGEQRDKNTSKDNRTSDILGLAGAAAIGLSDRREKENIKFVGSTNNVPTYFFNYKGSSKLEFGTMAQDVPHATLDMGGKLYVNYARL